MQSNITAKGRYDKMLPDRQPFLDRAREVAKLTIPALFPPDGHTGTSYFHTPYQSVGARGVNNLASRLLLTLLPPNSPFFRMVPPSSLRTELEAQGPNSPMKAKLDKALSDFERTVQDSIEAASDRNEVYEGLRNVLVGGNVMLALLADETRVYTLDQYVVRRSRGGKPLEMIIMETLAIEEVPEDILEKVMERVEKGAESVDAYTRVWLQNNRYHIRQEIADVVVPGSATTFPADGMPFLPLRFTKIAGENYGRSFGEEYFGDLMSLEELSKAVVEGAAAAAKVLFLLHPGATTQADDIVKAENLDIIMGRIDELDVLQLQKLSDFSVARQTAEAIEFRLSQAFLMNSSVQRDAERVTAEEIRFMAEELENALGGFYTLMAEEFQLPYAKRKIKQTKNLPNLAKHGVKPVIVTGLEALGRGQDLRKLNLLVADLAQVFGQDILSQKINVDNYLERRAAALGMDIDGLFKTQEEIQQEQTRQQLLATAQDVAPEVVKQAGQGQPQAA